MKIRGEVICNKVKRNDYIFSTVTHWQGSIFGQQNTAQAKTALISYSLDEGYSSTPGHIVNGPKAKDFVESPQWEASTKNISK